VRYTLIDCMICFSCATNFHSTPLCHLHPICSGCFDTNPFLSCFSCGFCDASVTSCPSAMSDNGSELSHETICPLSAPTIPPAKNTPLIHTLQRSDTLAGLSLKYNVDLCELRKTNKLFSDSLLHARRTIIVPTKVEQEEPNDLEQPTQQSFFFSEPKDMRWLVKQFQLVTNCLDAPVCRKYLENNGWSVPRSVQAYEEDLVYERKYPNQSRTQRIRFFL